MTRFWGWQVTRRTCPGALRVSLQPQNILFLLPTWSQLGGMIVATGSHKTAETALLFRLTRRGDVFYDVGANIGFYTVTAAYRGAQAVAFEPSMRARQALRTNVALSTCGDRGTGSVYACSDFEGEASFTLGMDVGSRLTADAEGGDRVSVPVARLDSVVMAIPASPTVRSLTCLKVDAEGHDLQVLRGATRLLAERQPGVVVETWGGGKEVRAFLVVGGYRVYSYDDPRRALIEFAPGRSRQASFLAIHDDRLAGVQGRLQASRGPVLAPPRLRGWVRP